jgi:tetratricopeptide (TPR) repeat protein
MRDQEMSSACYLTIAAFTVAACGREPHDPLRAISADVRAGRHAEAARRVAAADLPDRPGLAFRAAADASAESLPALAAAAAEPELATAVADRLEQAQGPKAGLSARERAATLAPERAEHHDALARARLDALQLEPALAAWDRAASLAPLQPAYHLMPIRALVAAGDAPRACARAATLAAAATAAPKIEPLLLASNAAAACGDFARSVELARAALALRPTDGRLRFTLGERLADAAHPDAAAALSELLICGAHGRPWHRHEVAARLSAFATSPSNPSARQLVLAALDPASTTRTCAPVDEPDLAGYLQALRTKLQ